MCNHAFSFHITFDKQDNTMPNTGSRIAKGERNQNSMCLFQTMDVTNPFIRFYLFK